MRMFVRSFSAGEKDKAVVRNDVFRPVRPDYVS